ncbi:TrmH family RNA methyltransferase [candidate division KSB1 bacterium]|nr:RNA methyltransferase [candidate division KSB1 bacterium]RQW00695.1 MAG: TrmH family RNA methyltransferase [candidate division KSB1 bacterium]
MSFNKIKKLSFEEIQKTRPDFNALQKKTRHPFVVLADNIRSVHNVGAIFRTADAVLLEHLFLCGITATPPRDEIRKTSLGAEESVPWTHAQDAREIIQTLRQRGYQIVSLEHTNKSCDYRMAPFHFPLCLIIGNEYLGIQNHLVELSDLAIEIPMFGIKHSLNVSVAFGIVAYKILSCWEDQA